MSAVKRLRIFAGPNGSGKSTFINQVKENPPSPNFKLGYYVNADNIERSLKNKEEFNFKTFGLQITNTQLRTYFKKSLFAPVKLNLPDLYLSMQVVDNILVINNSLKINSYIAADLSEFIRQQLFKQGYSFSYETVMSDVNKIDFLKKAKQAGYKVYLYYFATEDPLINISRVKIRVKQNGHNVKKDIIEKRYYKSLTNLKPAIKLSDRTYLFDTSKQASILVAEINQGKHVNLIDPKDIPNWFMKYVAN
jgi:predicted ABC-type ATPase